MPIRVRTPLFIVRSVPARIQAWEKIAQSLRHRAKKKGIPFDLTGRDLIEAIPADRICPITLTRMIFPGEVGDRWHRASVDKIIPARGYIRGNVAIISMRANTLKNNEPDPALFERIGSYIRLHTET